MEGRYLIPVLFWRIRRRQVEGEAAPAAAQAYVNPGDEQGWGQWSPQA